MNRQARRCQKAIDELIKIQEDGYGNYDIAIMLDTLWSLQNRFEDGDIERK